MRACTSQEASTWLAEFMVKKRILRRLPSIGFILQTKYFMHTGCKLQLSNPSLATQLASTGLDLNSES